MIYPNNPAPPPKPRPPCSPLGFSLFSRRCGKIYIMTFRSHDDRRPSKFIVLADNMKSAIKNAWKVKRGRLDLDYNSNRVRRGVDMGYNKHAGSRITGRCL